MAKKSMILRCEKPKKHKCQEYHVVVECTDISASLVSVVYVFVRWPIKVKSLE